jgi:hypothetical protein
MITKERYKQTNNPLLMVQQTEKEIRSDLFNKISKHEIHKHEFK